ncbi:MAG: tRNA uridine-5-carboxymethylaminomethyl(34) synthesis enzyme MnmG [Acholeplasmatales bacterium]|nr:MAG: tRNA uridine-5-carboxymethylaminomethyl(34) synthesis enzyme MnmG [Acholeplasmatales bacterium]
MIDVIVVGAGHAGCEAALASARLGCKTLLITGNLNYVASMPCNPSIGGPAKGIVVREIDALGGEMAKNTDLTHIQMRLLNASKGPAVQALRAQSDKVAYSQRMRQVIENQEGLEILEAYTKELLIKDQTVKGVILEDGTTLLAQAVILTTGTYLNSHVLVGHTKTSMGPDHQKPALGLSPQLRHLGFLLFRLKTGTPPRLRRDTIDFSQTERHDGDAKIWRFSHYQDTRYDVTSQYPCYLTYTNDTTHAIIEENLHRSAMYSGVIEGVGPRYCPSIEDKIVRFADKPRHQIFLEPESASLEEIYVQGFSTSMPHDVQERMIRSMVGLEQAVITKYAYAIEYDAVDARQLWPTLETKLIKHLYMAGQINGSSGYEEAACQGLLAGINAVLKLQMKAPLILKRHEAYIGVLIDDLVTKGTLEPYRLLTSRAEHRLLLRHDNADRRLMPIGHRIGLVNDQVYHLFLEATNNLTALKSTLEETVLVPDEATNKTLKEIGSSPLRDKITFYQLIRRPEISAAHLKHFIADVDFPSEIIESADIDIKYEGYIDKAWRQAEKLLDMERTEIPENLDYKSISNLALEARDKLERVKPLTLGQASRISGVNPSDISVLMVTLKTMQRLKQRTPQKSETMPDKSLSSE